MVDIETHRVVDLIESRDFEEVKEWLKSYPNLQVVSRDGSITYKNAIASAHPNAIQVSDRFHILKNLTSYCKNYLMNYFKQKVIIEELNDKVNTGPVVTRSHSNKTVPLKEKMKQAMILLENGELRSHICIELNIDIRVLNKLMVMSEQERSDYFMTISDHRHEMKISKKMELVELTREMKRTMSIRAIQRELSLSRVTITRYLEPNYSPIHKSYGMSKGSILDPHKNEIERLTFSGMTSVEIYRIIQEQGYSGSDSNIRHYCSKIKKEKSKDQSSKSVRVRSIERKHLIKLLYTPIEKIKKMDKDDLDKIYQRYPIYKQIIELVNMFRQMVRERNVNELSTWIDTAKSFENTYINSFIGGITRDMSAVKNAIAFDYNNGLAEGSVNKLKVMKRIMYGRNSFELLRKKMLRSEKRRKIN
jgi:hypothetical protein